MLKRLIRSAPIQFLLARLIWLYMAINGRTIQWTVEGEDKASALWENHDQGFIAAAWHSTILFLPSGWTKIARKWPKRPAPLAIMISLSKDGEFVAKAAKMLGLALVRGSGGHKKKKDKQKGGSSAIKETGELLQSGGAICITPDGPRGPRQRAGNGIALLGQRNDAPILIYALASAPTKRLNTWDKFQLPLPFGRGAIVFDGPIDVSRARPAEEIRAEVEQRLNAATKRAEDLCGAKHCAPAPARIKTTPHGSGS